MQKLSNKVAIVTGSSRGIGSKIALALASEGAHVVVNYTSSQDAADDIVGEIESQGGKAIAVQADVSNAKDVTFLFDEAVREFGQVDILVNNAGKVLYKTIQETSDEDFDSLFAVNVKGTFNALREATTRLEDGGRIINFSSTTTRLMLPTYGSYCATKGAVEQMTRVLSKELGERQITVNAVSPGPTKTDLFMTDKSDEQLEQFASMSALGRIGEPEDMAKVVLFLASNEADWVTGQNIGVNGGVA